MVNPAVCVPLARSLFEMTLMAIDGKEGGGGRSPLLCGWAASRAGLRCIVCMAVQAGSREFPILRIEKSVK